MDFSDKLVALINTGFLTAAPDGVVILNAEGDFDTFNFEPQMQAMEEFDNYYAEKEPDIQQMDLESAKLYNLVDILRRQNEIIRKSTLDELIAYTQVKDYESYQNSLNLGAGQNDEEGEESANIFTVSGLNPGATVGEVLSWYLGNQDEWTSDGNVLLSAGN